MAHGYLVLSVAAGLFVDPAPGPVLANTTSGVLVQRGPTLDGLGEYYRELVEVQVPCDAVQQPVS